MGAQTTRQIQRQIKGVKNVKQITHAMEMVSAAKLKRVEKKLSAIRPYWDKVREIFAHLLSVLDEPEADLLRDVEEVERIGVIVIAGDKGLCGSYNSDLFDTAEEFLEGIDKEVGIIGVGKKTKNWVEKQPYPMVEFREDLPTEPSFEYASELSGLVEKRFIDGRFDEVHIIYTHYINALKQEPKTFQFLPVNPELILESGENGTAGQEPSGETEEGEQEEDESLSPGDYIFEPDPDRLLDQFLPRYVNMLFYTILMESLSSEHGARMVAMRDATDNAEEKIDDLTYTYNQARQESITRELLDIVGAVEAQEQS